MRMNPAFAKTFSTSPGRFGCGGTICRVSGIESCSIVLSVNMGYGLGGNFATSLHCGLNGDSLTKGFGAGIDAVSLNVN